jgi:hypothetical protein
MKYKKPNKKTPTVKKKYLCKFCGCPINSGDEVWALKDGTPLAHMDCPEIVPPTVKNIEELYEAILNGHKLIRVKGEVRGCGIYGSAE